MPTIYGDNKQLQTQKNLVIFLTIQNASNQTIISKFKLKRVSKNTEMSILDTFHSLHTDIKQYYRMVIQCMLVVRILG